MTVAAGIPVKGCSFAQLRVRLIECFCVQGAYLTLGQFTTPQHWRNAAIIVTVVALGGSGLWAYTTVTETQKRQKYQRAYEEVQKMK